MELILSITLTAIIITAFFIIRNLIKRIENQEDIIEEYEKFIIKQSEALNACGQRIKEIDDKGIFYADDQVGWFFEELKKIQEALNEFTLK